MELTADYFNIQLNWLNKILLAAKRTGELAPTILPLKAAWLIIGKFEGTSIVSRVLRSTSIYQDNLKKI
ncbi:hypothetical protein HP572_10700 [Pectobacterium sp. PL64]|uniref:hypothetical protein n=1 Tax=Pectobacterium sp. PL64 TaxID=2738983 RepID=UPI001F0C6D31|nr:hypothetical protein [Pectobacterium sp. PL64]UMO89949.1 hypothetical protein HP572_10700 [Pectobacterium sp. PL64]